MTRILISGFLLAATCSSLALDLRTRGQDETEPKFIAQAGKVTGSCIDIFRAIEKADPQLRIVGDQEMVPLKRLESMLEKQEIDLSCGLVHTPERDRRFAFLPQALFQVHNVLIARVDEKANISSWDDVRKLGADGLVLGNAGRGPVDKLKKMGGVSVDDSAKGTEQNLQKLLNGRGRFFLHRSPGAMAEIRAAKAEGKVKIMPVAMSSDDYLMMVSKQLPANTVNRLNAALAKLAASGELKAIAERWKD